MWDAACPVCDTVILSGSSLIWGARADGGRSFESGGVKAAAGSVLRGSSISSLPSSSDTVGRCSQLRTFFTEAEISIASASASSSVSVLWGQVVLMMKTKIWPKESYGDK